MKKLKIIYEDKYIIVINKPAGLLTIGTEKEKNNTLYHQVMEYLRKKNNKIFIVHRLDKETSGLIVFAKDIKTKNFLQENWHLFERKYVAIVEGKTKKQGKIQTYLKESKTLLTYSTNDKSGKLAITEYKKLKENKLYTLLDINILTGRKNQIRVHMKDLNHPIIGDKKYNSKTNPINKLGLYAYRLKIIHPKTKKEIIFTTDLPKCFLNLLKI